MVKIVQKPNNSSKRKPTTADLHDFPDIGIHHHIFDLAVFLKNWTGAKVSPQEAVDLIYCKFGESPQRRPLQSKEVENAVERANSGTKIRLSSRRYVFKQTDAKTSSESYWGETLQPLASRKADAEKIRLGIEQHPWEMDSIWEESPLRVDQCSPVEILSMLFEEDELICSGTFYESKTQPLSEWIKQGFHGDLFCSNPMRCREGKNLQGKVSSRCRDNVGKRRFLVYECDDKSLGFDEKASLIRCLWEKTEAKLRMVVHSGNKSLHAFFEASADEVDNWRFMSLAVKYGGDPEMYRPEQQSRLPNAYRRCKDSSRLLLDQSGNKIRQKCLYLDPK